MRSRFDSSDHSEYSDDEPSQAESQKGIPHYDDDAMVDENSGGSPVNSPQSQEPTNGESVGQPLHKCSNSMIM